jgi:hypothetical protein|tara:strand:+ start:368 stop:790 length:423 start_codon:yes stop_codon:yes gene_type:complete
MASGAGGSGSGGFIVGISNPVGVGSGINYIGDFAYAYSGLKTFTGSGELLSFDTGTHLIDAIIKFESAASVQTGIDYDFIVEINGETVSKEYLSLPYAGRQPSDTVNLYLLLPPFSSIKMLANASSGAHSYTVTLRGRIH